VEINMPNIFSFHIDALKSPNMVEEIKAAKARGDIIVVDYPDTPPPIKYITFDSLASVMDEMKALSKRSGLKPIVLPTAPIPRIFGKWRDSQGNKPRR
jgi:hypothetical protein